MREPKTSRSVYFHNEVQVNWYNGAGGVDSSKHAAVILIVTVLNNNRLDLIGFHEIVNVLCCFHQSFFEITVSTLDI